jgi:tripartite-type tricarboxylate transporter receptor subunit TctC
MRDEDRSRNHPAGNENRRPGQEERRRPMGDNTTLRLHRRAMLAAAAAPLLGPREAGAQAWPTRPITIVVPYAPGGGSDAAVRAVGPIMERVLGQPIVVENRAGGGTAIGSTHVAQARPDGYTLLAGATPLAVNPALQPHLTPKEPMKELVAIGPMYRSIFVLHVHNSLPVRSLAEFVAHARANPRTVTYGSAGVGALNHLAMELLAYRAGIQVEHVPYRGTGPALLDLRAGRINSMFTSLLEGGPLMQERITRPIAVSSRTRMTQLPDVPAVAETLEGFDVTFWQGLFAPAGTPAPIITRLAEALRAGTTDPALSARYAESGTPMLVGGPEEQARMLAEDTEVWARVARETNLRLQ